LYQNIAIYSHEILPFVPFGINLTFMVAILYISTRRDCPAIFCFLQKVIARGAWGLCQPYRIFQN
jgi:hypothetical protein